MSDNSDRLCDEIVRILEPVQARNAAFIDLVNYWDRFFAETKMDELLSAIMPRTDNDRTLSVYDFEEI